ncbi:MAG: hypothetical protein ACJZ68_07125 [Limisphaerales bacterium]
MPGFVGDPSFSLSWGFPLPFSEFKGFLMERRVGLSDSPLPSLFGGPFRFSPSANVVPAMRPTVNMMWKIFVIFPLSYFKDDPYLQGVTADLKKNVRVAFTTA